MATVEVDDELLVKAKRILDTDDQGAVNAGLRQVIKKQAKQRLIDHLRDLSDDERRVLLAARDSW
jgi:Arc/MetJ family transcription regulator